MLGRVFEGVMAPDTRRASGTYYTPASLVGSVLDAAFVALLAGRLGCSEAEAERRLAEGAAEVRRLLRGITLLDPAAGSGAFLLGALERLTLVAGRARSAAVRRRILERNLFGVDRNPAAVRLTELRLWLAVVASDPSEDPTSVQPLPNLDCLIRQGDSLFDPVGSGLRPPPRAMAAELARLRSQVVVASGPRQAPAGAGAGRTGSQGGRANAGRAGRAEPGKPSPKYLAQRPRAGPVRTGAWS